MIKFDVQIHSGTPEAAMSSKVESEVEINRQRAPFWILFSLNMSAAEQNIFSEFDRQVENVFAEAAEWSKCTSFKIQEGGHPENA